MLRRALSALALPLLLSAVAAAQISGGYQDVEAVHVKPEKRAEFDAICSEGKLMKALEQVYALGLTASPVESNSKHWDIILVSHSYNGRPGHYEGAYLSGSQWQVKPGQGHAFNELINSTMVPVLDKLVADGSLVSYSVGSEDYHTQKPGVVSLVYTAADASGLDKVDAAMEAAFSKDHSIGPAIGTLTDSSEHRDFLLRVTHMTMK
jgi:hypothetical protein